MLPLLLLLHVMTSIHRTLSGSCLVGAWLIGGGAAAAEDDAQAAARAENARKLTEEVQRCLCLCIIIIIIVFNHTALFLLQIKRSKPLFGSKGLLITKVSPSRS